MAQSFEGYMEKVLMKTQEKMEPKDIECVHAVMTRLSSLGLMDVIINQGVMGFYTDILSRTAKAELEETLEEMISLKEIKDSAEKFMTDAINTTLATYAREKATLN